MKKILFDSDVIIEYLRAKNPRIVQDMDQLAASTALLAITPVTEVEIRAGLRSHERSKTKTILKSFDCLDLNRKVGARAGDYMRQYSKSHGLEIADALVAAASTIHGYALCTFNWKHFPMTEIHKYRIDV